ncbi:hypothetical protein J421_5333 (plasmid) [Gemmatirosa kalamazoonensis]|uniref:Uncharacterized protein n=1 Tax=Gemmatirosa kalamazoonensis TaxID=861299 RepID=W0RTF4_9BACT|nr:hypothetical protein [Gemmatirosa kalamazoonensis]AHG92868.1 hypothetical protein J421_5333 [Gemmatirosa kalamazoonensis]
MDPVSAPEDRWRATLRIRSAGAPATFDALLVLGGARGGEMRAVVGETPFELAVPDGEVTVVVRPRDPARPVVAEFACEVGGQPAARGCGVAPVPVLHFRPGGVSCGGLPFADGKPAPPAA